MAEDTLTRTLESVYERQQTPLIFMTLAEPVVSRVLENQEYIKDQKHKREHAFEVEGDEYQLTAYQSWYGGLPGRTHHIVFKDGEIDAQRTIEIHIWPNGEIFSYGDKREIDLDLPNGDKIEISSDNFSHRTPSKPTPQLPEPQGAVTVISADEEKGKSFRHVLIRNKDGKLISLVEKDGQVWDEVAKLPDDEQQKVLFEMSCQRFLGGVDFSLHNLID